MLKVEFEGAVLRLTLNRPEVRNALNDELIGALTEAFETVPAETRAVVLRGEGEAFCAGGDVHWMRRAATYTEEENYQDALRVARLMSSITQCRAVVIAMIDGACFGGGCGLAAACDVALASDRALFAFSEVKLGLVAATISPFVIRRIGAGHARALFTTGETFQPPRALQIGLVHEVGPLPDLDKGLHRRLASILASGPEAIWESKRLTQRDPLSAEESARLLARVRAGEEAKEGLSAFLEKRRPSFLVEQK